jgi:disulfide bond formation protein DsbB
MVSTTRFFAGFVLIVSAAVLGTALLSQFWGKLAPCELCLLQRWPWDAAIVIAIVVLFAGERAALSWVALIFAIVFTVSLAFAFYHVGVEQHWFAGPTACTSNSAGATTVEELKRQILGQQVVMCDRPAWTMVGVSMAGLNFLASLIMAAICIATFFRVRGSTRAYRVRGV